MKEHHIVLGLTAFMVAFALIFSMVQAETFTTDSSLCITSNGCDGGFTNAERCEGSVEGTDGAFIAYYDLEAMRSLSSSALDAINTACNPVCCNIPLTDHDTIQRFEYLGLQCEPFQPPAGATSTGAVPITIIDGGTICTDDSAGIPVCGNGQTGVTGSPCSCGGTPLVEGEGYCCDGTVSSDATCGGDTGEGSGVLCGNGDIDTVEQCDYADTSEAALDICKTIGVTGGVVACTNQCRCQYTKNDINYTDEYCQPGEESAQCQPVACEEQAPAPTIQNIQSYVQKKYFNVSWGYNETVCIPKAIGFKFYVREQGGRDISSGLDAAFTTEELTKRSYSVLFGEGVRVPFTISDHYGKILELRIMAEFDEGGPTYSEWNEFIIGAEACYDGKTSTCYQGDIAYCGPKNALDLDTLESCEGGTCFDGTGGAVCAGSVDCSACNEAYDSLAEINREKKVDIDVDMDGNVDTPKPTCSELSDYVITGQDSVSFCLLSYTDSALMEYTSCAEVSSCRQYTSPADCDSGGQDKCQLPGTCAWDALVGCYNPDPEQVDCSGDYDICSNIPGCTFLNEDDGCEQNVKITCAHLTTQESCTNADGTGEVEWRMSLINNSAITRSNDYLDRGKCRWGVPTGKSTPQCYKDSNYDGDDEAVSPVDFTNPVTTLDYRAGTELRPGSTISYSATDNLELAYTQARILSGPCTTITERPDDPGYRQYDNTIELANRNTGTYCIQYYSVDKQENHEPVQQTPILINANLLAIENVTVGDIQMSYDPSQDAYFYDFTLTFDTTRKAVCTLDTIGLGGGGAAPLEWGSVTGKSFLFPHHELPTDTYEMTITCNLPSYEGTPIIHTETLSLDYDTTISDSHPVGGTYRTNDQNSNYYLQTIGFRTEESAQCYSRYAGTTLTFTALPGGKEHVMNIPSKNTGYYNLPLWCDTSEGTVYGTPADNIVYAIDNVPPTIKILDSDGNEESTRNFLLTDEEPRISLTITCTDPVISGGGNNWEFATLGANTILSKTSNGWEPYGTGSKTITLSDDTSYTFSCEDHGGNRRSNGVTITASTKDISGPERPEFSVVTP